MFFPGRFASVPCRTRAGRRPAQRRGRVFSVRAGRRDHSLHGDVQPVAGRPRDAEGRYDRGPARPGLQRRDRARGSHGLVERTHGRRSGPRVPPERTRSPQRLRARTGDVPVRRDGGRHGHREHRTHRRAPGNERSMTLEPAEAARPANHVDGLFRMMVQAGASDLHLSVGIPPMVRKDGKMQPLDPAAPILNADHIVRLLDPITPDKNRHEFAETHDTDFAYEIPGLARFRANLFMDRKGRGGVFRVIPSKILTAEQLGLSAAILNLCRLSKGLVLVTGPTGSGKSTTLCAMVDHINQTRHDHIITIEDPIEFVHENKQCVINQREVHTHTGSFKGALRAALREDPDIVLVGEMRDLETVAIAIETAETGHLVFGTLHTSTAASTVDRVIDQFPADRQAQIRVMLSESLKGVISQTLCKKIGGGRVAALEVLIVTSAISNLIRESKTFQVQSMMQVGKNVGMVTLNDALMDLVTRKLVMPEEAYGKAIDKAGIEVVMKRAGLNPHQAAPIPAAAAPSRP
ncbi:MAG: type IV pili twitching motility protein PilT [Acidobacteria bacterium]|nr:MAG: type IV pili twitching motility protein PilT [Acidobacteriota bacterium]